MRNATLGSLALIAAFGVGCDQKKDGAGAETKTDAGSTGSRTGCVTELGAEIPRGDITLTEACGRVTVVGDVTIDARLTIEPGVTIAFAANGALHMGYGAAATLVARGTAEKPITFTSAGDKVAGWWKGVHLYANVEGATFEHVIIEYAGPEALRIEGAAAGVEITGSELRNGSGVGVWADGEHIFTKVEGTRFHDLAVAAMRIHPENLPELGANDYADRAVEIMGASLHRSATLRAPGTYRLVGGLEVERSASNPDMPTLTIAPGVIVEAVSGAELGIGYGNVGSLVAEGAADLPITFTGVDKAKDSWKGIQVYGNARNVSLKNVVVEYASSAADHGAVHVHQNAIVDLEAVKFQHLTGVGLGVDKGGEATAEDLTIDDAAGPEWRQP